MARWLLGCRNGSFKISCFCSTPAAREPQSCQAPSLGSPFNRLDLDCVHPFHFVLALSLKYSAFNNETPTAPAPPELTSNRPLSTKLCLYRLAASPVSIIDFKARSVR